MADRNQIMVGVSTTRAVDVADLRDFVLERLDQCAGIAPDPRIAALHARIAEHEAVEQQLNAAGSTLPAVLHRENEIRLVERDRLQAQLWDPAYRQQLINDLRELASADVV
jgi:hypothetical protein